mmetsp:Transcript_17457/g.21134  ORF Transcript_17457/g.21134 Transcript_17457/m.21134 type:complete len:272 (-) Transcript_17457:474-1289(-)
MLKFSPDALNTDATPQDNKEIEELLKNVTSKEIGATEDTGEQFFASATERAVAAGLSLKEIASVMTEVKNNNEESPAKVVEEAEADSDDEIVGENSNGNPEIDPVDLAFLKKNEKKEKHDFSRSPPFMPPPPPIPPPKIFNPMIVGMFAFIIAGLQIYLQKNMEIKTGPYYLITTSFSSGSFVVSGGWVIASSLDGWITYPYITLVLIVFACVPPAFFSWAGFNLSSFGEELKPVNLFMLWGPLVYNISCVFFARANLYQEKEWRKGAKQD